MDQCPLCGSRENPVAVALGACSACIKNGVKTALSNALECHARTRREWGLPGNTPHSPGGILCDICSNACRLGEGETGACGLRFNSGGKLVGVSELAGKASFYLDPLPNNCTASRVCAGGTGAGYPDFANSPAPEEGYNNLSVFLTACSFDCLFCQNWTYRQGIFDLLYVQPADIARTVNERTSCICFFGGDPSPQAPFALETARAALEKNPGRILRICWETNGSADPAYFDGMVELSLATGGCVKVDLKAMDSNLHKALTGTDNKRTLENFSRAAGRFRERPSPPLLVASTLLVPGYIDGEEVGRIASFIASLDPEIPYTLLAFHPDFKMSDLPPTSREQAQRCLAAAREAGLKKVHLGNERLLE